jgi:hypothetical protein
MTNDNAFTVQLSLPNSWLELHDTSQVSLHKNNKINLPKL